MTFSHLITLLSNSYIDDIFQFRCLLQPKMFLNKAVVNGTLPNFGIRIKIISFRGYDRMLLKKLFDESSVTSFGYLSKVLANILLTKVTQMFSNFYC